MVSDETFFAWLDGELDPTEAARVESAVAGDARLRTMAEQHRGMQSRLKGAFGTLLDAPLPEPILAAVNNPPQADVIDIADARKRRQAMRWPSVTQWGSMAATLVVGILVGTAFFHRPVSDPVEVRGGKIYAAAALGRALDTELASAPAGDVRMGLTFRDHGGEICRSFTSAASSGLACRDDRGWQLRGLFAVPPGQSTNYRMAAGMDPALAALVDSTIVGQPFDAAQERAAKDRHWN